jgi:hypothetical protein
MANQTFSHKQAGQSRPGNTADADVEVFRRVLTLQAWHHCNAPGSHPQSRLQDLVSSHTSAAAVVASAQAVQPTGAIFFQEAQCFGNSA